MGDDWPFDYTITQIAWCQNGRCKQADNLLTIGRRVLIKKATSENEIAVQPVDAETVIPIQVLIPLCSKSRNTCQIRIQIIN
jgi:hypothetical protein